MEKFRLIIDQIKEKEKLSLFYNRMKTCRVIVNTPASQGGIGDLYNFNVYF